MEGLRVESEHGRRAAHFRELGVEAAFEQKKKKRKKRVMRSSRKRKRGEERMDSRKKIWGWRRESRRPRASRGAGQRGEEQRMGSNAMERRERSCNWAESEQESRGREGRAGQRRNGGQNKLALRKKEREKRTARRRGEGAGQRRIGGKDELALRTKEKEEEGSWRRRSCRPKEAAAELPSVRPSSDAGGAAGGGVSVSRSRAGRGLARKGRAWERRRAIRSWRNEAKGAAAVARTCSGGGRKEQPVEAER